MIRGRLPFALAAFIAASCEASLTNNTLKLQNCAAPEDIGDLSGIVVDLKRDRTVLDSLRTQMSQLRTQTALLEELSEEARELVEHLNDF